MTTTSRDYPQKSKERWLKTVKLASGEEGRISMLLPRKKEPYLMLY